MAAVSTRRDFPIPENIEQLIDREWLSMALAPVTGGVPVETVELLNVIEKLASMVRIGVRLQGDPDRLHCFCLKAFLGWDRDPVTIREADFYSQIAPHISMRVPGLANAVIDRKAERGILIMEDVIAAGGHFRSALDPFSAEETAQSLDQLARLHAGAPSPDTIAWLPSRMQYILTDDSTPVADVQTKLNDSRGDTLDARTRDAALLFAGMKKLDAENAGLPQSVCHGDCHPGNVYMSADGPGFADWQLVQRGHWSYDVAYHICSVTTVETAEREERALLSHYLDSVRRHGGNPPDFAESWNLYQRAQIYGFFHWAIARSVGPPIRDITTARLGAAVSRHKSYELLGL